MSLLAQVGYLWALWPNPEQCHLHKKPRARTPHLILTSDSEQEYTPCSTHYSLYSQHPRSDGTLGGTLLGKFLGSHSVVTLWDRLQGGSPSLGFWVSWDWVKQQVQRWGPRMVAEWWNWKVYRIRQSPSCPLVHAGGLHLELLLRLNWWYKIGFNISTLSLNKRSVWEARAKPAVDI